jgi:hypothetical protein
MQVEQQERILCAAIYYVGKNIARPEIVAVGNPYNIDKGYVICGFRHTNIIATHYKLTGQITRVENEQGFLTSANRFVSREEAADIAFEAGQTKDRKVKLFSEDIY